MSSTFSTTLVAHMGELANIPLKERELESLAKAFSETVGVIENLKEPNTANVEPVHQVTGLENIMRDDVIDEKRMFTQKQALANAERVHQGFIMVPAVLKHK